MNDRLEHDDIRNEIFDPKSKITYKRGKFLGKGGFARCYEFENIVTGEKYAGKVISKQTLLTSHNKEKMAQEISIHSAMSHQHIISLHSYFEDKSNFYIILELCSRRSLMEMLNTRKTLTPPEVRYFLRQIVLACVYMHENRVIHRDLKLGNLFINDNMEIKVGDFGLATRLSHDGERKTIFCGTLNYIAPEILYKKGYSFEVDIWSLGCIMYALLVGTLPFEALPIINTFKNIKNNEYYLPQTLETSSKYLIQKLLHPIPECRPCAAAILNDEFFESGYIPRSIPTSCLFVQPKLTQNMTLLEESEIPARKTLSDKSNQNNVMDCKEAMPTAAENIANAVKKADEIVKTASKSVDFYLKDLLDMVNSAVKCQLDVIYNGNPEDAQDPSAVPFVWITKWVDYTDKYGIGYQLCDDSVGVIFNDFTHLVLLSDGKTLQYNDGNNEQYYSIDNHPKDLNRKITLLNYFIIYMNENLSTAGENIKPRESDEMIQVPHLLAWLRTKSAIFFHLTDGTFQVNFFEDHTKMILCPNTGAVSYIDESKKFTVYRFKLIEKYGCPQYLASKLRYARGMLERLYNDFNEDRSKEK